MSHMKLALILMNAILNYLTSQVTALFTPGTLYRDVFSSMGLYWMVIGLVNVSIGAIGLYIVRSRPPKVPRRNKLPPVITLYYFSLLFLGMFGGVYFLGLGVFAESSLFSMTALAYGSVKLFSKAPVNYNLFCYTLKGLVDNGDWSDEEMEIEKNRKILMEYFRHYWYTLNIPVVGEEGNVK